MATDRGDVLQGTLDMFVLKALQLEPMHEWGMDRAVVGERPAARTRHTLSRAVPARTAATDSLGVAHVTANNRRARYYALTLAGRPQLSDELAQWRRMSRAVNLVLKATSE